MIEISNSDRFIIVEFIILIFLIFNYWLKFFHKPYKNSIRFQQFVLVVILIGMIVYQRITTNAETSLSIIPWIWGFLAGHAFVTLKKRWINELLGLGILLAITIILFFKQTEIVQLFTENNSTKIKTIGQHYLYSLRRHDGYLN